VTVAAEVDETEKLVEQVALKSSEKMWRQNSFNFIYVPILTCSSAF
jgi:hypothetical protein